MLQQAQIRGDESDYVEFMAAGDRRRGAFQCSECGYGVSVARSLPLCPMCGGSSWEHAPVARIGIDAGLGAA